MIKLKTILKNDTGLHARPASKLTQLAATFSSNISLEYKDKLYNAKSIISILSAGIDAKSELTLVVDGADESMAMTEIIALIENEIGD